ncbi:glycosyltransferase [Emticicia sp. TH156]|uniref:glycosyltransferase n=1 Tax=Emticicia sp. TH156 TaxID=2067454 RepID=UPI0013045862|nr:glycosyltransferase [Emticicia sp. TH156]
MKILIVHSYYLSRGGEDVVFEQEKALLSEQNNVESLVFRNGSSFKGLFQFLFSVWNIGAAWKLKKVIKRFNPDVLHIHNWHFGSGPIIIRTAKKLGVPVVLTLHNYRLLCPSGSLMYRDKLFTASLQQNFPWEAVKRKVYRNSFQLTFWLAFVVWFHRFLGTWAKVDSYIALSEFAKELFLSSSLGLNEKQITVKPNFVTKLDITENEKGAFFLFVGRLTEEKGVLVLLKAFENLSTPLKIIGDGPLASEVIRYSEKYSNIEYIGIAQAPKVREYMQTAKALIMPSIWHEPFGLVIIEAFSVGTPVIASKMGAMASIIEHEINGLHFEANNPMALREAISKIQEEGKFEEFGKNAYQSYLEKYSKETNERQLLNIYNDVVEKKSNQ